MVFPGQGSQGPCMGAPWRTHRAWSLVELAEDETGRNLARMLLDPARPPTDVLETHLSVVLCSMMAWSTLKPYLRPVALAGHSLGLVSALFAAGVLSARDTIRAVAWRAQVSRQAIQRQPGGMAVLLAPVQLAKAACADAECWVANDNAPQQAVITGTLPGLETAIAAASSLGALDVISLEIAGAFHSPLMREAAARFAELLAETDFRPAQLSVVHNALVHSPEEGTVWADVMAADLMTPVRWRHTQLRLAEMGVNMLIEAGYGRTLTGIAKRTLPGIQLHNACSPSSAVEAALSRPTSSKLAAGKSSRRTRP